MDPRWYRIIAVERPGSIPGRVLVLVGVTSRDEEGVVLKTVERYKDIKRKVNRNSGTT